MPLNYQRLAIEGNNFLHVMAKELGYPDDTDKAGRVITAVLHVVRSQMTTDQVAHLISYLPMPMKLIMVQNWQPENVWPESRSMDDFLTEIKFYHTRTTSKDFPTVDAIENAIVVIFRYLNTVVPKQDMDNLIRNLPRQLAPVLAPPVKV